VTWHITRVRIPHPDIYLLFYPFSFLCGKMERVDELAAASRSCVCIGHSFLIVPPFHVSKKSETSPVDSPAKSRSNSKTRCQHDGKSTVRSRVELNEKERNQRAGGRGSFNTSLHCRFSFHCACATVSREACIFPVVCGTGTKKKKRNGSACKVGVWNGCQFAVQASIQSQRAFPRPRSRFSAQSSAPTRNPS